VGAKGYWCGQRVEPERRPRSRRHQP
jgi:hypothetical protein